ncbi:MAG: DUF1295 domain-containing protein [Anaerolineaceae bacterium]|nr:DUF1295 domain-containing protein [Anaerolineaceae bacterium]
MKSKTRIFAFGVITILYIFAAFLGVVIYERLPFAPWLSLLIADLAATLFIWVASLLLHNASVYDPYWSVQPLVILSLIFIAEGSFDPGSTIFILVVAFWSIRLTANWVVTFPGFHHQDWRYDQLEKQSGKFFPLVNLMGIQLMPTLIVFACILPGFYYISRGGGFNLLTGIGIIISLVGTLLELFADYQMHGFQEQRVDRSELIRSGLWRHARHPNYLGEILMWWGVYVVMVSVNWQLWYLAGGALINTGLFLFISIPMAEKRLKMYKANFEEYKQGTRLLLPFAKRHK